MVAKVAGGIIGLGLISTGGIAMAKPHWLGIDYMPGWHSLSEDNELTRDANSYTNKFGNKYKNYLVGSTHKKDNTKETNKAWWDWSYRRLEKTRQGKFKGVTNGYGGDTNKDLNKVCEEAYKKETNGDLKGNGESNISDNEFKKSDVWKYCSPGLLTHTNQDENKYGPNTIGGASDNTSKLVSVKDSSNDWFWEIRNKDFWSAETSNEWSGSKAQGDKSTSIFKKEHGENSSGETGSNKRTIKDLCKEAYSKDKGNGDNKNNTDALKFCVLEAS